MHGAGFGVSLKSVVLPEYGHREQDQFLEEKSKGSRKVTLHFYNALILNTAGLHARSKSHIDYVRIVDKIIIS